MKKLALILSFVLLATLSCVSMVGCDFGEKEDVDGGTFVFKYVEIEAYSDIYEAKGEDYAMINKSMYNSKYNLEVSDDKMNLQSIGVDGKEYNISVDYSVKHGIIVSETKINALDEFNTSEIHYELYDYTLVRVYELYFDEGDGNTIHTATVRYYYKNFRTPEVAETAIDIEGKTFYCDSSTMIYDQSEAVTGDNAETSVMFKIMKQVFSTAEITFNDGVATITNFSDDEYNYSEMEDIVFEYEREGNLLYLREEDEDHIDFIKIYLREDGLTLESDSLTLSDSFWGYCQTDFNAKK